LLHKPELGCVIIEEVTIWGQVGTTSGITIEARQLLWDKQELQNQLKEILFWNTNRRIKRKIKTTSYQKIPEF
jgi:hypothetical protein